MIATSALTGLLALFIWQDQAEKEMAARIEKILAELASEDPETRDRAADELYQLGRRHIEAIEKAWQSAASGKLRGRLELALARIRFGDRLTRETLSLTLIDFDAPQGSLDQALGKLGALADLRIEINAKDPAALKVEPREFQRASLEGILNALARAAGIRWYIKDERKIVFTDSTIDDAVMIGRQIIDVRALTLNVIDRWIGGFEVPEDAGAQFADRPAESRPTISGEDLVRLIRSTIEPESWDQEHRDIIFQNGLLFVRQTPEAHQKINEFLASLTRTLARPIRSNVIFIGHRPDFLAAELSERPVVVGKAMVDRILKTASEGKDAKLIGSFDQFGYSSQVLSGFHGREVAFVCQYDGDGGKVPRYRAVPEGVRYQIKPMVSHDSKQITVEFRASLTKIESIEKVRTPEGDVQVPNTHASLITLSQTAPVGEYVLMTQAGGLKGFGEGITQLMVIGRFEQVR